MMTSEQIEAAIRDAGLDPDATYRNAQGIHLKISLAASYGNSEDVVFVYLVDLEGRAYAKGTIYEVKRDLTLVDAKLAEDDVVDDETHLCPHCTNPDWHCVLEEREGGFLCSICNCLWHPDDTLHPGGLIVANEPELTPRPEPTIHYEVWYAQDWAVRVMSGGYDFAVSQRIAPTPEDISRTHTRVKTFEATSPDEVFTHFQAEIWSPRGEARDLIRALGLSHTSMSVGDLVVEQETGKVLFCDRQGWVEIGEREWKPDSARSLQEAHQS